MKHLFIRANNFDCTRAMPRAIQVYKEAFPQSSVQILNWRRTSVDHFELPDGIEKHDFVWAKKSRSLKAVMGILVFQFWLVLKIIKIRPTSIQFYDFESSLPSTLIGFLLRIPRIYDMRDPFADCYNFHPIIRSLLYSLDWISMALSTSFVLPAKSRAKYLGRWGKTKTLVLANTVKDSAGSVQDFMSNLLFTDKIKVGFLGYLHPSRGRDVLINLAEKYSNQIVVFIAGVNSDVELEEIVAKHSNIHYLGMLSREKALGITKALDVNMMMYDPSIPVNRLADPNKFYESLMLGTPVALSEGMELGENVEKDEIGFLVEYGDFDMLFNKISVLKKVETRTQYQNSCREHYLANFDYENDMDRYVNFYLETLNI